MQGEQNLSPNAHTRPYINTQIDKQRDKYILHIYSISCRSEERGHQKYDLKVYSVCVLVRSSVYVCVCACVRACCVCTLKYLLHKLHVSQPYFPTTFICQQTDGWSRRVGGGEIVVVVGCSKGSSEGLRERRELRMDTLCHEALTGRTQQSKPS